jgi:hypothetical protein
VLGTSKVDYTFYPNGTVIVEVMCSNHPFRLQTEEDRSRLLGFFGQLQQVLMSILSESHERIVPNVLGWELTERDINKDVKVSDWFHLTGLRIQVKHMDHLFSLYIKSMGKDTVYRAITYTVYRGACICDRDNFDKHSIPSFAKQTSI